MVNRILPSGVTEFVALACGKGHFQATTVQATADVTEVPFSMLWSCTSETCCVLTKHSVPRLFGSCVLTKRRTSSVTSKTRDRRTWDKLSSKNTVCKYSKTWAFLKLDKLTLVVSIVPRIPVSAR